MHPRYRHRHRGHDLRLGLRPDVVHQHHRQNHRHRRLERRHRNLGVSHQNLHQQDDQRHRRHLGDLDHRHRPDDLDHLGDQDHRHQPDDPDPDDPCPAKVRMGCYLGVKLGEECPCLEPKRMGCYLGEECPEQNLVRHRLLAWQPLVRSGLKLAGLRPERPEQQAMMQVPRKPWLLLQARLLARQVPPSVLLERPLARPLALRSGTHRAVSLLPVG